MNKPRLIFSSACAAIITIAFIVIITIWAELSAPLKDWLKNFSGHHWTSKSILSVLSFAVVAAIFYFLSGQPSDNRLKKTLEFLLIAAAFGIVIITAFFIGHHFRLF
ncbi:MAG: hypothetical protein AAB807_00945 [Patescibacteria group bacterium]